jgi:hypothetical protein
MSPNGPPLTYAPKRESLAAYMPAVVKLRNLEIASAIVVEQQASKSDQVENSISPTPVPMREAPAEEERQEKAQPSAASSTKLATDPIPHPRLGKRLLLSVGTWLLDKGKEQQTTVAAPAPVSLAKTKPATVAIIPAAEKLNVVPEGVARRFVKVDEQYYFPDKTPAFVDRGNQLATRGAHPEVVRSLVEIAKARGWDNITVKGTEEFRRSTWMEAAQNGMKVEGYKPTAYDLAAMRSRPANNIIEKAIIKEKANAPVQTHQQAEFPDNPTVSEKPTAASQVKIDSELEKKAKSFEAEKPSVVIKRYPELAGAYGLVAAAKAFAAEILPEAAREEFVGLARQHVIQKITAGEQIRGPKVYVTQQKTKKTPEPDRKAEPVDMGKAARQKTVARER